MKPATPLPPPAIRPGLAIGLLVVLGLTVWQATQGDDAEELAPAARGARKQARTPAPATGARDDGLGPPAPAAATPAPQPRLRSATGRNNESAAETSAALDVAAQRLVLASGGLSARGDFAALSETGRKAWSANLPPPPPPAPAPPPPPPMAPPFPYQMVGRWEEPAAGASAPGAPVPMAVISGPTNTWVLKAGDVLDGQWRVDSVSSGAVQFTYLPLSQSQTVSMKRP